MSYIKIKNFAKFFESAIVEGIIKEVNKDTIELVKMELYDTLVKNNKVSEEDYINQMNMENIMRDICDIFTDNLSIDINKPSYVFYQKDFDFSYKNKGGMYIFETEEDLDTFTFDLINQIQNYKL